MKSHLFGAVSACTIAIVSLSAQAVPVSGQGTWETTLQPRDFDGNTSTIEAYYDTTLDITWLTDANANGLMTWDAANTWAASLDVNGVTGWRLPTMMDTGPSGCDYAFTGTDCGYNVQTGSAAITVYSEIASLFYDTLGNLAYYDTSGTSAQSGWGLTNTGPFNNVQSGYYWSGLEYAPVTSRAWNFFFNDGYQGSNGKTSSFYALAVRPGDVSGGAGACGSVAVRQWFDRFAGLGKAQALTLGPFKYLRRKVS
ncbi:MAG: hypothetical protein BMS9Abin06_1165 [Gammaproteobacteria bacterium]|nr:MAG: hypothetical protein BMS9Abin06_1165 [Gammaproteobacteria bacterium]